MLDESCDQKGPRRSSLKVKHILTLLTVGWDKHLIPDQLDVSLLDKVLDGLNSSKSRNFQGLYTLLCFQFRSS